MGSQRGSGVAGVAVMLCAFVLFGGGSSSLAYGRHLSRRFYDETCPDVTSIVSEVVAQVLYNTDPRIAASLLRLHFHDCVIHGCDGSLLLDNSADIRSEKEAIANKNSARGFNVIDEIKAAVEYACPATVSCADILTIAATESVSLSGGPSWSPLLGRRDSTKAYLSIANVSIPGPFETLDQLKAQFTALGLDSTDLVALSGAHTFGRAQCRTFSQRLFNFNQTGAPDPTLNVDYLKQLQEICPQNGKGSVLNNLDPTTPNVFDNNYFSNLQDLEGLLQTDQELYSTPGADTIKIVNKFSANQQAFFDSFVESMIKLGNLSPLTGNHGEIRLNCRRVNYDDSTAAAYVANA